MSTSLAFVAAVATPLYGRFTGDVILDCGLGGALHRPPVGVVEQFANLAAQIGPEGVPIVMAANFPTPPPVW